MIEIIGRIVVGVIILIIGLILSLCRHNDAFLGSSEKEDAKYTPDDIYKLIDDVYANENKYPRFKLQEKGIFGLPSKKTIKQIAEFVNENSTAVLSIGAKNGTWELLIADSVKVPVYAIDAKPDDNQYFPVEKIVVPSDKFSEYIKGKNINTLFSSWVDYESPMVTDAIGVLKPKYLIYVGEGAGGCTGNNALHKLLKKSKKLRDIYYKQQDLLQDYCAIYELNYS